MIAFETMNLPLILCGLFYGILCIFSIVTGLIYMSGKRKLNPLELSDSFVERLSEKDKLNQFTIFMGFVTFAVGIVQGITSYCLFQANSVLDYYFVFGFTVDGDGRFLAHVEAVFVGVNHHTNFVHVLAGDVGVVLQLVEHGGQ